MIAHRRHVVGTLAVVLLSTGCGLGTQFRAATEPQGGARARLRVVATDTIVKLTPGKACHDGGPNTGVILSNGLGSHGFRGRSLGMPGKVEGRNFAEVYVEAGKPLSLVFLKGNDAGKLGCDVSLSFRPEAGKDYEATVSLLKVSTDRTLCVATAIELGTTERVAYTGAPPCE